jgi:hypothetical protein
MCRQRFHLWRFFVVVVVVVVVVHKRFRHARMVGLMLHSHGRHARGLWMNVHWRSDIFLEVVVKIKDQDRFASELGYRIREALK